MFHLKHPARAIEATMVNTSSEASSPENQVKRVGLLTPKNQVKRVGLLESVGPSTE
jgi:hypothetical protein